jgi:hypothetical protein
MRYGALISAVCHVGLVSFVMLSTPRQFVASERSIEAELVRADEIDWPKEQPQEQPKEQPKPEKPSVWDFPEEKLRIELPKFSPDARPNSSAPAPSMSAASKGAQPATAAASQQQAQSAGQQQPSAPSNSQQAALAQPQSSIAQQAPAAPAAQKPAPSVFDPASIPMLMDLPNAAGLPEKGFDFEATVTANISGEDRAAFKAHLRKCWKLPDGLSPAPNTRVVLRVYLKRDGALASEPVLIEASASRDGPAVLLAAKSALAACQPYSFPAEKYREWRILDLTFTPKDMAGG